MACRSACETQDHVTYAACVRASGIRIGQVDATAERRWDREINEYRAAREQGIQPSGTSLAATRRAVEASDRAGVAFDAGSSSAALLG